jgi:hypothetical protein
MDPAPAWLSYTSAAIALVALAVSIATYLRAAPRVRARLRCTTAWGQAPFRDMRFELKITNSGLAPVDVAHIYCGFTSLGITRMAFELTSRSSCSGPDLPYRLESNSVRKWEFTLNGLANERRKHAAQSEQERILAALKNFATQPIRTMIRSGFFVEVELGNGIIHSNGVLGAATVWNR